MRIFKITLLLALVCLVMSSGSALAAEQKQLYLYAGAGMKKALDPINQRFQEKFGVAVAPNYGPSGGLYTQITQGQPCDIFFSADWKFIEKLEKDGKSAASKKFLNDFIVLVASPQGQSKVKSLEDITRQDVTLTVADPRAPVGQYTANGLKKLGVLEKLYANGTIKAQPSTVNQVAIMIQKDQVDAGFTYSSVATMYGMKPVATMGNDLTGEIVFGICLIKGGNLDLARKFMSFTLEKENTAEFTKFGWKLYE